MPTPGAADSRPADPRRILILRPGAFGDIVRTLPAVRGLRIRFPEARLEWIVYEPWRDLLDGHPDVDEILVVSRRRRARAGPTPGSLGLPKLIGEIRRRRYDLTLDFQGTLRSGILGLLSGSRRRYGYSRRFSREGNFLFNNHRVVLPTPHLHRVERNLALARAVGAPASRGTIRLPIDERHRSIARGWLAELGGAGRRVVLIIPGTSRRQAYKRWPAVHFGRLAVLLRSRGLLPVLGGGPGEEELTRRIAAESNRAAGTLPPSRIPEMAAFMLLSSCVVAGDTGPMHLASALSVPVIALFGGTDPRLNAPWGPRHRVLDGCPRTAGRRYRKRRGERFLASVLPETVAAAVAELLAESGPPTGDHGNRS